MPDLVPRAGEAAAGGVPMRWAAPRGGLRSSISQPSVGEDGRSGMPAFEGCAELDVRVKLAGGPYPRPGHGQLPGGETAVILPIRHRNPSDAGRRRNVPGSGPRRR
jgi:hypothetical protein